jgi:hypothetical protein
MKRLLEKQQQIPFGDDKLKNDYQFLFPVYCCLPLNVPAGAEFGA